MKIDHKHAAETARQIIANPAAPRSFSSVEDLARAYLDATEWRPIETAPKDGTPVDLWVESVELMRYPQCVYRDGKWFSNFGPLGQSSPLRVRPTHWRPLPEPPTT